MTSPYILDVYKIYEWVLKKIEPIPVLLERDFKIPNLKELTDEDVSV